MARPFDSVSRVAAWLATFQGRRHGSGVSIVPSFTRSVRTAIAPSSAQASTPYAAFPDENAVPTCLVGDDGLL